MRLVKIEKPLVAYVFKRGTGDDDTNFAELEADVKADGGTVERVADDLVIISIGGGKHTLPLNFGVFPALAGKIVSASTLEEDYAEIVDGGGFDLDGLLQRVTKIESDFPTFATRLTTLESKLATEPQVADTGNGEPQQSSGKTPKQKS